MLIPFETLAVILYLASISGNNTDSQLSTSLLAISCATLAVFILVSLEVFILLKRGRYYTRTNRIIITTITSINKIVSCAAVIAIFEYYHVYNILSDILPSLPPGFIQQNIAGMLIFVLITIIGWLPWFYIHKRVTPGLWTIPSYIIHKFRYTFFILGIWLPGIILTDYMNQDYSIISSNELELYSTILFLLVAWIFPVFLRKFWGCSKLDDTELRDKISTLTANAGVKIRGVYLWNLGGKSIPNAAMVGFFPPFQYLFISHGLISRLSEEEVLGVVGHEIGHLKKHHILFYLLMSIALLSSIEPLVHSLLQNTIYTVIALVAIFFLYIRFVFAWFSRRFEREADLFSAELLGDFRPLSRGLERIGLACGNIRNEASWHHHGINERVWFLEESFFNQTLKKRFKQGTSILRYIFTIIFISLLMLTVYYKTNYNNTALVNSYSETKRISPEELRHNLFEVNMILGKESPFYNEISSDSDNDSE